MTLSNLFLGAAMVGGALFLLQMLISVIGSADADTSADHDMAHPDAHWAGIFSFRSVTAAVTVFGLSGLVVLSLGGPAWAAFPLAGAAGVMTLLTVALVVRAMLRLADDGTFRVADTVGTRGVVYVNIPKPGDGVGKVHLHVQGRTVELEAAAADQPLPTGTPVVVTAVVGPNAVEVVRNF